MARRIRRTNRKNSKRLNSRRRSKVRNHRNTLKRRNTMKRRNINKYRGGVGDKLDTEIWRSTIKNKDMITYAKNGNIASLQFLLSVWLTKKTNASRDEIKKIIKTQFIDMSGSIDFTAEDKPIYGFLSHDQAIEIMDILALNDKVFSTIETVSVGDFWNSV